MWGRTPLLVCDHTSMVKTSQRDVSRCWRLDDADRAEIVRLYASGRSLRGLAEHVGCSYGTVHNTLVDLGVALRPRGGPRARRRPDAGTAC